METIKKTHGIDNINSLQDEIKLILKKYPNSNPNPNPNPDVNSDVNSDFLFKPVDEQLNIINKDLNKNNKPINNNILILTILRDIFSEKYKNELSQPIFYEEHFKQLIRFNTFLENQKVIVEINSSLEKQEVKDIVNEQTNKDPLLLLMNKVLDQGIKFIIEDEKEAVNCFTLIINAFKGMSLESIDRLPEYKKCYTNAHHYKERFVSLSEFNSNSEPFLRYCYN